MENSDGSRMVISGGILLVTKNAMAFVNLLQGDTSSDKEFEESCELDEFEQWHDLSVGFPGL